MFLELLISTTCQKYGENPFSKKKFQLIIFDDFLPELNLPNGYQHQHNDDDNDMHISTFKVCRVQFAKKKKNQTSNANYATHSKLKMVVTF